MWTRPVAPNDLQLAALRDAAIEPIKRLHGGSWARGSAITSGRLNESLHHATTVYACARRGWLAIYVNEQITDCRRATLTDAGRTFVSGEAK